jgi:hypothetical protein
MGLSIGVKVDFSQPDKPTDNAFVESMNVTFRDECLNIHWFSSLNEANNLSRLATRVQWETPLQGSRREDTELLAATLTSRNLTLRMVQIDRVPQ